MFEFALAPYLSDEELQRIQKTLTIKDVQKWVGKTGGHNSRLAFFEMFDYARESDFYQIVAKLLLSIPTAGSIPVEREAMSLKILI